MNIMKEVADLDFTRFINAMECAHVADDKETFDSAEGVIECLKMAREMIEDLRIRVTALEEGKK